MGQQHDFYLVQSGNLVPGAALWRGFLVCFQQPSLLRSANLDSSDLTDTFYMPRSAVQTRQPGAVLLRSFPKPEGTESVDVYRLK